MPPAEQPEATAAALVSFFEEDHDGERGTLRRRAVGAGYGRAVLGDEHVNWVVANTTELTADFQDFISRYAWGDVWSRLGGNDGCGRSPC
ncbi:MAG: hypothetical protein ACK5IN_07065 [Microbacterium sp.]|uniref:hypothetical protein n=1 Tax=Microbacterium sp. TaxID=51671 RepID=UPI003A88D06C